MTSSSFERRPESDNNTYLYLASPADTPPDLSDFENGYPSGLLQGQEAIAALNAYADEGEFLKPPAIPEYESFDADKAVFDSSRGLRSVWGVVRDHLDPDATDARLQNVGKYWTNNRGLAYVEETGRIKLARGSVNNVVALRSAGYRQENIPVPFSNGEIPAPGSSADLHLRLFELLDEQDEVATGRRIHGMDLLDPDQFGNPAVLATRSLFHLESPESSDYRTTNAMDPDTPARLRHDIQTLQAKIDAMHMDELQGREKPEEEL